MLKIVSGKRIRWLAPIGVVVGVALATGGVAVADTNVSQDRNAGAGEAAEVSVTAPNPLSWSAYRQPNLGDFTAVDLTSGTAVDADSDTDPTGTAETTAAVNPNTGSVYRWWCLRGTCRTNGWTMTLTITEPTATNDTDTLTDATASPEFDENGATIAKVFGPDAPPSYNDVGAGSFNFGAPETIVTAGTANSQGEWKTTGTFPRVKYTISATDVETGVYTSTVDWDLQAQ